MEKVKHLQALPGCCWKCSSSNREWYIDTGMNVEFHGAVYLCNECIQEMAHVAGMVTTQEADALRLQVSSLEEDKYALGVMVVGLEQAVDGLRLSRSFTGTHPERTIDVPPVEPSEGALPAAVELGSSAGETVESNDDSDVGELHADESSVAGSEFSFTL